jgi:hypothetical protein
MQVVRQPVAVSTLTHMAERMFGNLVKAVVDVDLGMIDLLVDNNADGDTPECSSWYQSQPMSRRSSARVSR